MKKTKRLWSILLAGTMLFSLTACTGNGGAETESSASQSQESSQPESSAAEEPSASEPESSVTAAENGDILVVYYSATGNTEVTGGDLFELEPAEPYTDEDLNWTDDNSRVSQEYADESLRDVELVSTTVENWDSYDTVYIGYPIWWGIAAWPVNGFVSANDFTGKTVIPFATSSSSGMGESGELLAELAGTGDWQEGQRFSSGVSETDVTEWVNNLGITE